MSGGPITISIASDTRQFQGDIDDVTARLQEVTQQLDAQTEAGDRAGQSLQDAMDQARNAGTAAAEAGQEASEGAEQAARSWQQLGEAAEAAGAKTRAAGDGARPASEEIEESGKLGEAALMNLGYSAMSAGELFSGGLSGMAEQVGTFAAFLGPAFAGIEGSAAALAWPITIAGVAVSALAGLMDQAGQSEKTLQQQTKNLIDTWLGSASGVNALDEGLRAWAKDADDYGGTSLTDLQKEAHQAGVGFGDLAASIATQSLPQMQAQQKGIQGLTSRLEEQDVALKGHSKAQNAADGAAALQLSRNEEQLAALGKLNAVLQTNIDAQNELDAAQKALADQMGLSVSQYDSYQAVVQEAASAHVHLSNEQKVGLQAAIEAGQSTASLKKQITDYQTALSNAKQEQQAWDSTVEGSFASAASASSDWAKSQKQDLAQVATNLQEQAAQVERLPGDIQKALAGGLSQAGLKLLESLPNGEQIIDQIGLGDKSSAKLIAAANRAGADAAKSVGDGLAKVPPVDFKVTAIPDDAQARKERDFLSQDIKATVDTQADIKKASSQMQSLVAQKRTATVIADADTEKAKASIDQFIEQPRTAKISAAAETAKAEAQLKALEGKRSTTVFASADVAQAERQLQAFLSKPRSITVTVNQRPGSKVN